MVPRGSGDFVVKTLVLLKNYRFKVEKAFKKRYRQRVSENVRVLETGQLEFVSWEQWKSMDSEPGRSGVGEGEKREGKL